MFFEDIDFSFLDETESFNEIMRSFNLLQENIDYYNRIKFLLEDELVDDTKNQVNQQQGGMVQKILAWIREKMQMIVDFAQNLYSNNRFEAIKNYIKNNIPDGTTLQVPEVLTTIPSQVNDLETYLNEIIKGNYQQTYKFNLPDKTKLKNVNKAGLIQIVTDLQQSKSVFPKITAAFNRARNAVTQDNEKGSQVLSAMKDVIEKVKTIFKDSASMINSTISNYQSTQTSNEVNKDMNNTTANNNKNDVKKSESYIIFDNVFDYMVLDESRNVLVSESREEFFLLNNVHEVFTICENSNINNLQKASFVNLKNNADCLQCLDEYFEFLSDIEVKYILFKENGNIVIMCEEDDDRFVLELDRDLNLL